MYKHPATLANLQTLKNYGVHIVPAETGELASGLSGEGRMAEPPHIVQFCWILGPRTNRSWAKKP